MPQQIPPIPTVAPGRAAWWIGPAFVLLAAGMTGVSMDLFPPHAPAPDAAAEEIIAGARRQTLRDPPAVTIGGYSQRCNDCHRLFVSPERTPERLVQHEHIRLDHGINDRCFNCHHRRFREQLHLVGGGTGGFERSPELCARCHGPTYRDWQAGTHGKTLGSWDPATGEQRRLLCSECHDPHAPAYAPIRPLPGPDTLRMKAGHGDAHDPHTDPIDHGPEPAPEMHGRNHP